MKPRIMLDPGHYGKYNRSPIVPEYYESDFAWDFHLLLKAELEKRGCIVGVTRDDKNKDLEVTKRGSLGEGYHLLLSLHSNASSNPNKDRTAVYYQVQTGDKHEQVSLDIASSLAPAVNAVMECEGDWKVDAVLSSKDRDGDGYKDDYYGVLRGASFAGCPAVIIEHSYHTNERATRWLMDEDNLKLLAEIEADAIVEFFGGATDYEKGDINRSGNVDYVDAMLMKRAVMGTCELNEEQKEIADMNGDGEVDYKDYMNLKRDIMG